MKTRRFLPIIGICGGLLFGFLILTNVAFASLYGRSVYGNCAYGEDCSITLATSGTVTLDVLPTQSGAYSIQGDEVEVTTDSLAGYTLSLEMGSEETNELAGIGGVLESTTATAASPASLSGTSWGFRVDGLAGFGTGPTTPIESQPSSSLTFGGVPLLGSPITLKTTDIDASSGDITDVWYGVRADSAASSGAYTGTVVYTAVAL